MFLLDAHAHLGFLPAPAQFLQDPAAQYMYFLSSTVSPAEYADVAARYAHAHVAWGLGAHPWYSESAAQGIAAFDEVFLVARPALIGEIGLDFAHGAAPCEEQIELLWHIVRRCTDSARAGKAHVLSVHAVGAMCGVRAASAVLDCLEDANTSSLPVYPVFHWFSGTSDELMRAIRGGCYFSINPRMLKTAKGRDYVKKIPAERLLLETDWPAAPDFCDESRRAVTARQWHEDLECLMRDIAEGRSVQQAAGLTQNKYSALEEVVSDTSQRLFLCASCSDGSIR